MQRKGWHGRDVSAQVPALVNRPDVPTSVANATGDTLETDGAMAVLLF
jgi:hypothetical protein